LTDIPEGPIVRVITRLDETCREVRDAARVIGDADLFTKMEEAQALIKRDSECTLRQCGDEADVLVVFAASLVCLSCVRCRLEADCLVFIINHSGNRSMSGFRQLFRKYYQHCMCKRILGTCVCESQRARSESKTITGLHSPHCLHSSIV
jgi:hypothetical protein